jgi:hypothetical protein
MRATPTATAALGLKRAASTALTADDREVASTTASVTIRARLVNASAPALATFHRAAAITLGAFDAESYPIVLQRHYIYPIGVKEPRLLWPLDHPLHRQEFVGPDFDSYPAVFSWEHIG